jgi:hypothetical protein
VARAAGTADAEFHAMADIVFCLVAVAFFALATGYTLACERL